jgi:hypothetical protein
MIRYEQNDLRQHRGEALRLRLEFPRARRLSLPISMAVKDFYLKITPNEIMLEIVPRQGWSAEARRGIEERFAYFSSRRAVQIPDRDPNAKFQIAYALTL